MGLRDIYAESNGFAWSMLACIALTRDHEPRPRRGGLLRNLDAPRRTKQPSLRYGCTKATGCAFALFRCHFSWPEIRRVGTRALPFPNSRFRSFRLTFRVARGAGDFVNRGGGFRVLKPCQRPTGLSGGTPHGEGRRPSCRGGIPTRWTARSAGRQGFGRSWSRVAQIHICRYMRDARMQATCRILA